MIDEFNKNFFVLPKEKAIEMFYRRVHNFVGIESVGYRHIEALYDLGYLPIRIKALPEGSVCPIRVPMMTITNTKPEFFWLTNYLETLISCTLWMLVPLPLEQDSIRKNSKDTQYTLDFRRM